MNSWTAFHLPTRKPERSSRRFSVNLSRTTCPKAPRLGPCSTGLTRSERSSGRRHSTTGSHRGHRRHRLTRHCDRQNHRRSRSLDRRRYRMYTTTATRQASRHLSAANGMNGRTKRDGKALIAPGKPRCEDSRQKKHKQEVKNDYSQRCKFAPHHSG